MLKELNPYVNVSVLPEPAITPAVLTRFQCVVVTHAPRSVAAEWNEVCRAATPAIPFIYSDVFGAAGFCFSDFGPAHLVKDKDGEPIRSTVVVGVNSVAPNAAAPGRLVVHVHDQKRHGFEDGDEVIFREVKGLTVLNDGKPRKVGSTMAYSFDLLLDAEDVANPAFNVDYIEGGVVENTKIKTVTAFASLRERELAPVPSDDPVGMLLTPDLGKFGRPEQLHIAFAAVEAFRTKHGHLPPVRDAAAVAECVTLARNFCETAAASSVPNKLSVAPADVDAAVVTRVAALARSEFSPMSAFFGGVVAQEVVKVTGKYSPLRQWLYLDAFEIFTPAADPAAPADVAAPASEFAPAGERYDGVASIIGNSLQARIMNQRVFLVGCGALGCEFLKSYALMGIGCGPEGRLSVTDMDRESFLEPSHTPHKVPHSLIRPSRPPPTRTPPPPPPLSAPRRHRGVELEPSIPLPRKQRGEA